MELDETLPLWYYTIGALKSYIKYSDSVKKTVSDIKVTDIFCELHEDAVEFWGGRHLSHGTFWRLSRYITFLTFRTVQIVLQLFTRYN